MTKRKAKAAPAPVGRPSKYRPEYCEQLINHMSQGLSFETFGAMIDVDRDTLYEWAKVHEDFSDAKKTAFAKSQLFYERMGVAIMAGKVERANVTAWIFNMKNRFKWRDNHKEDENDSESELKRVFAAAMAELDKKK